jgi:hypothetical protein
MNNKTYCVEDNAGQLFIGKTVNDGKPKTWRRVTGVAKDVSGIVDLADYLENEGSDWTVEEITGDVSGELIASFDGEVATLYYENMGNNGKLYFGFRE